MDYVLAERGAFLTLPARKEGIIPGAANMRLPRFTGDRIARQAIQYERRLDCDSPEGRLICDEIVPAGEMDAALDRVVEGLTNSGVVSAASKPARHPHHAGAARYVPRLFRRLRARTGLLPLQPGFDRQSGALLERAEPHALMFLGAAEKMPYPICENARRNTHRLTRGSPRIMQKALRKEKPAAAKQHHASDLRSTLDWLRQQGDLIETEKPVDPDLEITGLQKHMDGGCPVLFNKVKGKPNHRVLTNLFSDIKVINKMFGWKDRRERVKKLAYALSHPLKPVEIPQHEALVSGTRDQVAGGRQRARSGDQAYLLRARADGGLGHPLRHRSAIRWRLRPLATTA